jgi:hypothetical protein
MNALVGVRRHMSSRPTFGTVVGRELALRGFDALPPATIYIDMCRIGRA